MKINYIGLVFLIAINVSQSSCSSYVKKDNEKILPHTKDRNYFLQLKSDVLSHGDIEAYEELSQEYMGGPTGEFLIYALVMANKYDYGPAYYDVYGHLINTYTYHNIEIDTATHKMMQKYLKRAYERGVEQAKEHIE